MAESHVVGNRFGGRRDEEEVRGNLKYLDFVHMAGVYVAICFYGIYEFTKSNSGPLLPGIQSVEDTVKAVLRPLYDKFRLLPLETIRFFDHKLSGYVNDLDSLMPLTVKRASNLVCAAAAELHEAGVVGTAKEVVNSMYYEYKPTAREVLVKNEPVVGHYVALACRWLNALPLFPWVVMEFLPSIPMEMIAKMVKEPVLEPES